MFSCEFFDNFKNALFTGQLWTTTFADYWVDLKHWSELDKLAPLVALALHEKCPYSELFWSVYSRIWSDHGDLSDTDFVLFLIRLFSSPF